ncbi:hypothetical protein EDC18_101323 [Natranaerovirga pectinivora]|uniref:Uncharacterized protein n=1 Tax=Natranaerovirga pectinivora TaxID=682400 RepID=A0A4R3MP15_9FIRM|nr:hypothetical protein [Natranaerovirga pectinivora]TCT17027.1 hypothetical protein EDC18_101323 [Natranaerovirga pectinivora]
MKNKKLLYNSQIITNKVVKNFRKLLITVYNNPDFVAELGWVITNTTNLKVLLIDSDALESSLAQTLGMKNTYNTAVNSPLITQSSFNIAMDYISKETFNKKVFESICVQLQSSLYVLTGNDNLENYEYYPNNAFVKLLNGSLEIFDIVLVNTNSNIYDEFLIHSFYHSDILLFPIEAYLNRLHTINSYLAFLHNKQNISIEKGKFISFNYRKEIHLPDAYMKEITNNNFIGRIDYDEKRLLYKNYIDKCYAKTMPYHIKNQYNSLLYQFNITQKKSFLETVKYKLSK